MNASPNPRATILATILALGCGCTHWVTKPSFGPPSEVARRVVGAPQVEEVSSSNVSAGFAARGSSYSGGGGYSSGGAMGGLSGSQATVKRTHCVQQAQVDFVQPVQYESHVEHRTLDVAGSIILGVVGLSVIGAASNNYSSDLEFYNRDPQFFPKPEQPTGTYAFGGAMLVGAGAWLIYSLTSLPNGPAPMTPPTTRAWTETAYVEAQGCGLVPADRPPPAM